VEVHLAGYSGANGGASGQADIVSYRDEVLGALPTLRQRKSGDKPFLQHVRSHAGIRCREPGTAVAARIETFTAACANARASRDAADRSGR
jgi:hypothetical protein